MALKPLFDRVIVRQIEAEEKTKSGIILSSAAKEKPAVYEVVEVGPGGKVDGEDVVMVVKKGDKVVTGSYSGTEIKLDGDELKIVRQSDILAIVE
ncbi:MAG: co-chaperone GroES [Oscillospiraceae bacterium]|jgi:chaperonin GroES|nr:co-chaperone GroES [Oscillospiraceae bacterium]